MRAQLAYRPSVTIDICRAHYAETPSYVPRLAAVTDSRDHGCEVCSGQEALRQSAYSADDLRALRNRSRARRRAVVDRALAGDATAYMDCARVLDRRARRGIA